MKSWSAGTLRPSLSLPLYRQTKTTFYLYRPKISQNRLTRLLLLLFVCLALWNLFGKLKSSKKAVEPNLHSLELNYSQIEVSQTSEPFDTSSITYNHQTYHLTNEEKGINLKYCGMEKCRFLFPAYIGEQESKAQQHLRALMAIAERLGRILVLPNVGDARISACRTFPFEYYYSMDSLQETAPDSEFMMQKVLYEWAEERKLAVKNRAPSSSIITILTGTDPIAHTTNVSQLDLTTEKAQRTLCVKPFFKEEELESVPVFKIQAFTGNYWTKQNRRTEMMDFIVKNLEDIESEVFLVDYDLRFDFLGETLPLKYADHLIEYARATSIALRPYIAIHWRMERTEPTKLPDCATSLVQYINATKEEHGITNVYLATDYPIEGGKTHSGTFKGLTDDHHGAIKILKKDVAILTWSSLHRPNGSSLPIARNIGENTDPAHQEAESGAGILGILDKLVLVNADWFVSGPPECCKKSSFTNHIIKERHGMMQRQKDQKKLEELKEELKKLEAKLNNVNPAEEGSETFFDSENGSEQKFKLSNVADNW